MRVESWLGENNHLGIDIWKKKYQHNNEAFDAWLDRVSGKNDEVRQLIIDKKFLFGGRILSNRGLDTKKEHTTLSNCYVISPPEDNIESIYDTCKKLARTYSYGGGCGIDISKLAPAGAKVHNQAKTTSGAVSFMDTFNQVTEQIGQNGRRGALMISLDCEHPDLEKFINVKTDLGKVTSANISVRVTDDFMKAIVDDEDWTLSYERPETGEKIEKTVRAKDLFKLLCKNNWNYAEPAMLFWDSICDYNLLNNNKDFSYAGTNPCLTGDTLISTTNGEIPIKELVDTAPDVYCMDENGRLAVHHATKVWLTRENAQIVTVHTSRGDIRCTPDHLIHTRNKGWVAAQDLRHGDKITGLNRQMRGEAHVSVGLSGSDYVAEHRLVAGFYNDISGKDVHHIDGDTLNNRITNLEVLTHSEHSKISNTGRSIEVVRDANGRYKEKQNKSKRHSFNLGCNVGTNWTVQEVEWLEQREDVYDMTVPVVHNFVANRMVVHNCAEEPLPAGGSCLLGSINLAEFVKDGKFDTVEFERVVSIAVRALNDVLDEGQPLHPLTEQRESVRNWRQIGLGIMGLADMLIKCGIRYGSEESIDLCNNIGYHMARTAIKTSAELANEIAPYPMYNHDVLASNFYKAHFYELFPIDNYSGLRNSQLLTIAPTGTISTMIGVSGGIEPIFANSYNRTTKSLHGHDEVYKVYTPIVEKYMHENNITNEEDLPNFFVTSATIPIEDRIAMQSTWQLHIDASISSTINLPNEATVEDVENLYIAAWENNLKGVTVYRAGCAREGILIADDANKNTQIASTDDETYKISDLDLPWGTVLECSDDVIGKKRKLRTGCGSLHVLAFFDQCDGSLQEVYLSKGSTGGCANFMTGLSRTLSMLCRAGVDVYAIKDQLDSTGVCPSYATRKAVHKDTSKGSCCPMAIGNALIEMYEEMQREINDDCEEEDATIAKPVSQSAKKETPKCPECGEPIVQEGGCIICKSCGWSKCD